jgi:hypothetical protein
MCRLGSIFKRLKFNLIRKTTFCIASYIIFDSWNPKKQCRNQFKILFLQDAKKYKDFSI